MRLRAHLEDEMAISRLPNLLTDHSWSLYVVDGEKSSLRFLLKVIIRCQCLGHVAGRGPLDGFHWRRKHVLASGLRRSWRDAEMILKLLFSPFFTKDIFLLPLND
jgi:hypothetical protein